MNKNHATVEVCAEVDGMDLILMLECNIENSGIGSYECHGYRGYDKGVDYVESFEVFDALHDDGKRTPLNDAEIAMVNDALAKDDALYDSLVEKASEVLAETGDGYEDFDDKGEDE